MKEQKNGLAVVAPDKFKEDLRPKDQMDEEMRRLCLATLTVVRRRYPNDFKQMLVKFVEPAKAA